MTFLPIVERELRVASRKRSTFRVRVAAALVAVVIGGGFLVLTTVGYRFGPLSLGKGLFGALTWLSLAVALSAGLFFTSDCLSEEKRKGTLGFLFLTDLRGYDIIFGKLLATSLRGACALLAVFPVLAVTLLMGGVSGVQLWKTSLALINALMISLAAGLFVSTLSRDSQKAQFATLVLMFLVIAGGPASDGIIAAVKRHGFIPALSLTSPGFLFVEAGAWGQTFFWPGLLANQVVAWVLFSAACLLLPRTWQEKAARRSPVTSNWTHAWKFGGAKRRAALRRKLIEPNPVLWLACRERWQMLALWALTVIVVGGSVAIYLGSDNFVLWMVWSFFSGGVTLVWYLAVASQACRLLVEAKHAGLIELWLATPLTVNQIVQGQSRALLRMFGPPLAFVLAAQVAGGFLVQDMQWNRMAAAPPAAPTGTTNTNLTTVTVTNSAGVTITVPFGGFTPPGRAVTLAMSAAGTLTFIADLAALTWFGMWMGLNSKTTNLATLKTIAFVQIVPWFVIGFASALVVPLVLMPQFIKGNAPATTQMMVWFPLLMSGIATLLSLAKDMAFLLWARRKLYSDFRERAIRAVMPLRVAPPPPAPRSATPPVIAPT